MQVKCQYCYCKEEGGKVDKSKAVRYKDKNYHEVCYQEQLSRETLILYIRQLWGLKGLGPRMQTQINQFINKQGYTHKGILNSLKYFYEVKKNDKNKCKGQETLGIVPYVYDDAQLYYENIEKVQDVIADKILKQMEQSQTTLIVKKIKEQKTEKYDLDNL